MLVLVLPPVSSRVSGFPVASPCLWGKLQNLSFYLVASCENCRKSRTKCWFFCIHVSCLEALVFLWRRRVYGGSWKTCPFRMFPSRLSCCFAWQTWHFLTFQPVWWCSQNCKIRGSLARNAVFSASTCLVCVSRFPVASPCLWGKLENLSFSNVSKQVVMLFCVADVALFDIPTCLMMFTKLQNSRKSRTKCCFFCIHVSCLCFSFSCGVVVSMGEAAKPLLFECFQAGCHVVLHGRRGTLWHSNLFDDVHKIAKFEEVSHEMLFFLHPRVLSVFLVFLWRRRVYGGSRKTSPFWMFPSRLSCRFAWQAWHFVTFQPVWWCSQNCKIRGSLARNAVFSASTCLVCVSRFPVASSCLWGKPQNLSFLNVSKQVVMSFCMAGVALCDIPTCLITCRNVKIGWSLAWNVRFSARTCLVSSLWFSCGVAVSMGEVAKCLLCQGFKFWMYWIVGSVRLAVCKDMARVRLCWRWKVVVWTHPDFTQCRLYIFASVSANISAVLHCKRTSSIHSSWQRGFMEILQEGDFRMFVTDIQANVACTGVLLIQAWSLTAMLLQVFVCRGVISAGLNSKRTLSFDSSWGMVFLQILQDGDFRMFVRDMQANVACTEVLLIQAWRLIAMLLKIFVCRHVTVFRHVMDVSFCF